jgi:hypothetical protein
MQIQSKGLVRAAVVGFALATAPFAVLAQQFKAPPPPDCAKAPPQAKAMCEADLKAYGMCKDVKSGPEFGACMQKSRPFVPPPAPNCAAAPAAQKAACDAAAKKHAGCVTAAKNPAEFGACMQKPSAPPPAGSGTPPPPVPPAAGGFKAPPPPVPPAAGGFKAPPPPDCAKAPPQAKAMCEADLKAYGMCKDAKSGPEFGACMQKSRPFVPPPAPNCAAAPAAQKAACDAAAKKHAGCVTAAKNPAEFVACMQKK